MSGRPGCNCDPELVFELADRSLPPAREREVRAHVERCPGCRERYEQEKELNARLGSLSFSGPRRSVCEGVAMALPTRPVKVRLLWTLLAGALLVISLAALGLNGSNPAALVVDTAGMFGVSAVILADLLSKLLAVAGPALLMALVAGALLDLLLAAILLAAVRRTRTA